MLRVKYIIILVEAVAKNSSETGLTNAIFLIFYSSGVVMKLVRLLWYMFSLVSFGPDCAKLSIAFPSI